MPTSLSLIWSRTTNHFRARSAQRRFRTEVCDLILAYGCELRAAGATHLVLIERRLPPELRGTEVARRARGWILVLADDGAPLTCYRRTDAVRFLRRKPKRRLTPEQRGRAAQAARVRTIADPAANSRRMESSASNRRARIPC